MRLRAGQESQGIIDDIVKLDATYRSEAFAYSRLRRYLFSQAVRDSAFNVGRRRDQYWSLRLLIYETTRRGVSHHISDLFAMIQQNACRLPPGKHAGFEEAVPEAWERYGPVLKTGLPITALHFALYSRDRFAWSTLDGVLHFGYWNEQEHSLAIGGQLSLPHISFLKFAFVSDQTIVGCGVASALYVLSDESRCFEVATSAVPSELVRYGGSAAVAIYGCQNGGIYSVDLSEMVGRVSTRQASSTVLTKTECKMASLHHAKRLISALAASGEWVIAGTSEGDVVAIRCDLHKGKMRVKHILHIPIAKILRVPAKRSVDWISFCGTLCMINTRSDEAGLFQFDGEGTFRLVKSCRALSSHAKCASAVGIVDGHWSLVCGMELGDLVVDEDDGSPVLLSGHEAAIVAVEFIRGRNCFVAADASGVIACWRYQN